VTAGNCCPLNDGAAAVVVMSDRKAKELGLTPLARVVVDRRHRPLARDHGPRPGRGSRKALRLAGMSISDIDLYEINEAFAVQVLGSADELGMDFDKLNVHGGAIALGHPFGSTGARITSTCSMGCRARRHLRAGDDVRRRRSGHGDHLRAPQLSSGSPRHEVCRPLT
jgi:acetyl-CoA C-acetyltransferase